MRRLPPLILLFICAFTDFICASAVAQVGALPSKYALIIAIGDYPKAGGWPKLSSDRDADFLHQALLGQGFPEANIITIRDTQATMTGIRKAFGEITGLVRKGDVVLVHVSSHGEQVEADNDNKVDGLDECIVTYNALSPNVSAPENFNRDQADYLRGHTLGSYLVELRARLGPNGDLLVIMDNCHSGDGTRGTAVVRGDFLPFVSPSFDPLKHHHSDSSVLYRQELGENDASLAKYVVISATRPDELDVETVDERTDNSIGSLTYAVCRAFENFRAGTVYPTYRAFFARIASTMNLKVPDQHPLLEGNGQDRQLFGGNFIHQAPYIEISDFDTLLRTVTLKQGTLAGLDTGALIGVYPSGIPDTLSAHPLARGIITSAGSFSSVATLEKALKVSQPQDAWVFVTQPAYRIDPVGVGAGKGFSQREAAQIQASLSGISYAVWKENPEMTVVHGREKDTLKVSDNAFVFAVLPGVLRDTASFHQALEAYARYKFLQSVHSQAEGVSVDVRLVPVVHGRMDTAHLRLEYCPGDTLTLWIRNTGTKDAYVNILDMQPDGIIHAILPNTSLRYPLYPHDLKILVGQDYFLSARDVICIDPPYGTEVFKVFASESEIDLEKVATPDFTTRGRGRVLGALEKLVRNTYEMSRGDMDTIGGDDATTSEVLFIIKPKIVTHVP